MKSGFETFRSASLSIESESLLSAGMLRPSEPIIEAGGLAL